MKSTAPLLLLFLVLIGCDQQSTSTLHADSTKVAALPADAPASIEESQYESQFNTYVQPLFEQGESGFFTGVGGKRLYTFRLVHPDPKANIVISHGYGECILKYRETMYTLFAMGYSVYFWEHRGHGHSDRLVTDDRYKTHVEDFNNYVTDMETFVNTQVPHDRSLLLFGHSMGAGIATAYLEKNPTVFKAAVLNAPLLDLNTNPYPAWVARAISGVLDFVGKDTDYAPGQTTLNPDNWTFDKASTTSRPRFDRNRTDSLAADLTLGGVTVKWLREVLKTTPRLIKDARLVKTPILLFQPQADTYVKPEGQNTFCAAAPDCTLIKIPGSRHEAWNEADAIRRDYWNKAAAFLQNHI